MPEVAKIILGTLITFGLHGVFWTVALLIVSALPDIAMASNIGNIVFWSLLAIGLSQLVYMVPIILWFIRVRDFGWVKGFIVGAVMTALLNGGCWLVFGGTL
ncbi:MAG: hypothetical protein AAF152_14050 [Cyanobacteria bacterium P01_A01_bin.114]